MFKARMKFSKTGRAKYISHLDLMHTMQRVMARCAMPIWFTEGFNQHAYVSVALPLSTGYAGEWEFLDFNLLTDSVPDGAVEAFNAVAPEGLRALEIYAVADGGMPLREIAWARYQLVWNFVQMPDVQMVQDLFARDVIEICKRSKRGEKVVNIREWMQEFCVCEIQGQQMQIEVVTAAGNQNLSPEYITQVIARDLPAYPITHTEYHRLCVYNTHMEPFR